MNSYKCKCLQELQARLWLGTGGPEHLPLRDRLSCTGCLDCEGGWGSFSRPSMFGVRFNILSCESTVQVYVNQLTFRSFAVDVGNVCNALSVHRSGVHFESSPAHRLSRFELFVVSSVPSVRCREN